MQTTSIIRMGMPTAATVSLRLNFPTLVKSLLISPICVFLFTVLSADAAITVHSFGEEGTGDAQIIAPLDTMIGAKTSVEPDYRALTSSNPEFNFIRHVYSVEDNICYYWFRADEDPTAIVKKEEWNDVYWYVGGTTCTFVDGAKSGSNNYVLLHSQELDKIVGVLQYSLNENNDMNDPARLMAYAVNPEGMTFAEGVAAIQGIPEPSSVLLSLGGAAAALVGFGKRSR